MIRYAGVIMAIALVAVALRWIGLDDESLWFDEGMTWWLMSLPPVELIRVIRGDVAAPLHYLLLHGWGKLFGDTDVAMRSFSATAATLTLIPFFILVRRSIQSHAAALVACGLMAVSFMQIQYAREARYYALLSLATITALACVPTLARRRHWGAFALLVLSASAGMYTHNIMMFYLPCLFAAWLVWPGVRPWRGRVADMVIAAVALAVLYLPWVPILMQQLGWMTGSFWAERPTLLDFGVVGSAVLGVNVWDAPGALSQIIGVFIGPAVMAVVLLGALATGIGMAWNRKAAALAIAALGPVVIVFLYSQFRQPIFFERVFTASSAVVPILLAMAIERSRWAGVIVTVVGVLTLLSSWKLITEPHKEDWRGAYGVVASLPPSDRRLVVFVANEGELPFWYYAVHDRRFAESRTGAPQGFFDLNPPQTIRRVLADSDLAHLRRHLDSGWWGEVVLVLSHTDFSDPQGLTEREMRSRWVCVEEKELRQVKVLRFSPSPLAGRGD